MTALLYLLVAVSAISLATEAFLADRNDPARRAFLAFSFTVGLAYLAFALSLLPGLEAVRSLHVFAAALVPATALWTLDRAFVRDDMTPSPAMRAVYVAAPPLGIAMGGLHAALYEGTEAWRWPAMVVGLFAAWGFGVGLSRLARSMQTTPLRIDRTRMGYLFGILAAAIVFSLLEGLARQLVPPATDQLAKWGLRIVALQGPVPPLSTVFAGLGVYFLYHSVVMSRLLDVTELFSRATTVSLSALALVLTIQWVGTMTTTWLVHSTFHVFVASLLFLAAYDPLRERMARLANRFFDRRSAQLASGLDHLTQRLPTIIDTDTLVDETLSTLHASGRVPVCSMYLWDDRQDAFTCADSRGHDQPPLAVVAEHPFADRFTRGAPWYLRSGVRRRALHDPEQAEVLALMDAMNADLTLPFMNGNVVVGWVHLRDEPWSDGYSAEDILKLQRVAAATSVVLGNIRSIQAREEQKRLAALGAMAAGLAHEIRNPLAGVKGAAQFLQSEPLAGEAQEMLQVVIDETDRLNIVVSQFLDYARPFELNPEVADLNAVVHQALMLVRAQGLPEELRLVEHWEEPMPAIPIDRTRMSQVFINLLQNALQAMPDGGALTVRTRRTGRRAGPSIEVAISDTGAGIDADVREKLFVPFFTTKQGGTGLGLPICRRIVEAHGGELDVHSVRGQGSTFVVRLDPEKLPSPAPLPRLEAAR